MKRTQYFLFGSSNISIQRAALFFLFLFPIYLFLAGQDKILISHLLSRIRDCMTQLYAKDITPDDKQELDEALQREV